MGTHLFGSPFINKSGKRPGSRSKQSIKPCYTNWTSK